MGAGKRKNGFYLWTVRLLVLLLVFGQFGVYGGSRAYAASVQGGVLYFSNDSQFVLYVQEGKLKSNMNQVQLRWQRSENIPTSTLPSFKSQLIAGETNDISQVSFGTYHSTYTGEVKHAFVVEFNKLWEEYHQVDFVNGDWLFSETDPLGNVTPIDVYDTQVEPLSLVINAETGQVVDLVSNINPYYYSSEENYSFIPEIVEVEEPTVPIEIPTELVAKVSDGSVELSWSKSNKVTSYEVEVNGTLKGKSYINTWVDNSLNSNSVYDYRVRAVNSFGASEWSDTYSVKTLLSKPSLNVIPVARKNTIQWSPIGDADFYQLQIDEDEPIQLNNTNSYDHADLVPGSNHSYKLKAFSSDNESLWSNTYTQLTVSDYESGLRIIEAKSNQIKVSWQAVSGATGYELEIDGKLVSVSGTSYTKTGLTPDSQHTFRVRTKNKLEVGSWSNSVLGLTQLVTPVLKTNSFSSKDTQLFWQLIKGASYYEIEMDGNVVGRSIDPTYIVEGLNPGESHKYRIRALSDTNDSAWTGIVSQVTQPDVVTGLYVTASTNKSITLKWNAVKGATAYDLEVDGVTVSISGTSYIKSNLLSDTDHVFRIRSKNAAGVSTWSEQVLGLTKLVTPILKGIQTNASITLTWVAVPGATSYEIEADGNIVGIADEHLFVHSGLVAGSAHKYRIRAISGSNLSDWTTLLTVKTLK
ncbi:fibronectin type III domain-containing protein [Paenibacillus sp. ALJ109b]|uniref:fibronectin type III domain-containing protein n=1 Tax=Paenibacillus sp. ALJ109b TaxID=2709068 RepID=UPI0013D7774D|nr:fibronectin type III domain-containing protein [Paenibacillus sp. ALJ109b]NEU62437.1 fibronectin type III domain-containing protein [Paenibacillus sp. ALJ109b]